MKNWLIALLFVCVGCKKTVTPPVTSIAPGQDCSAIIYDVHQRIAPKVAYIEMRRNNGDGEYGLLFYLPNSLYAESVTIYFRNAPSLTVTCSRDYPAAQVWTFETGASGYVSAEVLELHMTDTIAKYEFRYSDATADVNRILSGNEGSTLHDYFACLAL